MSYTISVIATSKKTAKAKVAVELAKVVGNQPVHAADVHQAQAVANSMIDTLADDPVMGVSVSLSGSLGWRSDSESSDAGIEVTSAAVSANAWLTPR